VEPGNLVASIARPDLAITIESADGNFVAYHGADDAEFLFCPRAEQIASGGTRKEQCRVRLLPMRIACESFLNGRPAAVEDVRPIGDRDPHHLAFGDFGEKVDGASVGIESCTVRPKAFDLPFSSSMAKAFSGIGFAVSPRKRR
jgi:hypothetical protein